MKRILISVPVVVLLLGIWGVSHAVTIDSIDFKGCISEACQTPISVVATDPAGGNLSYDWEVLNGPSALIVGSGPDVVFDPPDSGPHPCPYKIKVAVTSDASGLTAYETIDICVKLAGDVNGDGVVSSKDLREIRDHFGETGDPGWITADLNCDGVVDARDLRLVRNTFGQTSTCSDSYFFDNFECGSGKWRLSGSDWGITAGSIQEGLYSLTDSPGENYPNYANSIAKMESSVDLTTATFPVLTFWYKSRMSTDYYSDDYIYVDVSIDGGWTWTNIWTKHDHNQSTWRQVKLDLSSYMSDMVKIRFRLVSDETGTADGFSIDDVEIREFNEDPQAYPFFDDFESGADDWIISGTNWNLADTISVSAAHSLTESVGGNYPNYAHSVAELAGFMDLTAATFPVLTFWYKCRMSTDYYSDDYIYVDVSSDGGWTWTNIWTQHDHNQSTWRQIKLDLSPYISDQVKIRFRLVSDETGTADGFSIDDVEIREFDEGLQAYPFFDDFESGTDNWIISGTNWNLTDTTFVSATHSLTESVGGNYPNYAHSVAETAGFMDLSTASFPVLTFWHKCSMSTEYYSDDYIYVDVSSDGGLTWTNIWNKQDLNQSTWVQEMINLTPYISSQVKIRFRLVSDETGTADGWYIDDVAVAAFPQ